MRKFINNGHQVYIISPSERRDKQHTRVIETDGFHILSVRSFNVQKTNVIEKGLGQFSLEFLYQRAIKKYFSGVKFDLILYSTPPITLNKVIETVKRQNPQAMSYLLLKDIFPQNALDLGMLSKNGLKGILYKSFRKKEKKLYSISDFIGCMSPANVKYLIKNNPEVDLGKVEIAPNSIELTNAFKARQSTDRAILEKYNIPADKPIFIYGGNLGKPQGIPFLIKCLDANSQREDCHFLIVGDGFEYPRMESWYFAKQPKNVTLLKCLSKNDYDKLVQSCHVGLIFLDYRFTIPNFPSRLLSYLECGIPVVLATDLNSDMGPIAQENGFGYWCQSNDVNAFTQCVNKMLESNISQMGEKGYRFLCENYLIDSTYSAIIRHLK
jgi:glycosyltransferase involved in cell wall biosynthesis